MNEYERGPLEFPWSPRTQTEALEAFALLKRLLDELSRSVPPERLPSILAALPEILEHLVAEQAGGVSTPVQSG